MPKPAESYIIIIGDPVDGFRYFGPFMTHAEALEKAEEEDLANWWVAPLYRNCPRT